MAVSLKHAFNCAKADGVDATAVKPSDWNAEHQLTAAAGKVLGTPAGSTTVSELPIEVDASGQSVKLPSGTTVQRPASPGAGMVRYNTSTSRLEYYTNGAWKNVDNMTVSATQPPTAIAGDFWIDTANGNALKQYNGAAWADSFTVANGSVTYAKLQNVSATSRVLGRKTAGAGSAEELSLSDILDFVGSAAQGDILYRGASGWARLPAGTAGQVLRTNGAGADPVWANSPVFQTSQPVFGLSAALFSGIPSGVRSIEVHFSDVSLLSGTRVYVRLGTSSGVVATGYKSASHTVFNDSGGGGNILQEYSDIAFSMRPWDAGYAVTGAMRIRNISSNLWVADHTLGCYQGTTNMLISGGGAVGLSGVLDRIQVLPSSGTFDFGIINVSYT